MNNFDSLLIVRNWLSSMYLITDTRPSYYLLYFVIDLLCSYVDVRWWYWCSCFIFIFWRFAISLCVTITSTLVVLQSKAINGYCKTCTLTLKETIEREWSGMKKNKIKVKPLNGSIRWMDGWNVYLFRFGFQLMFKLFYKYITVYMNWKANSSGKSYIIHKWIASTDK